MLRIELAAVVTAAVIVSLVSAAGSKNTAHATRGDSRNAHPTASRTAATSKSRPATASAVRQPRGNVQSPPTNLNLNQIPSFYSPRGVLGLRVTESAGRDGNGGQIIGTTWKWTDSGKTSYTLTRQRTVGGNGTQDAYTLTKIA